jgi:type II secretory pathway component PulJ
MSATRTRAVPTGEGRGVALLEVLAALTIFAVAAVSVVGLLAQSTEHERRAEAAEHRLADEERLLTAMTLLTRDDLHRRLGRRTAGSYVVETLRPAGVIYRITVGLADAPDAPDLATLIYRPGSAQ